ncbi:hypothetical protein GCM10020227_46660 [Streptomyces flavovirens]
MRGLELRVPLVGQLPMEFVDERAECPKKQKGKRVPGTADRHYGPVFGETVRVVQILARPGQELSDTAAAERGNLGPPRAGPSAVADRRDRWAPHMQALAQVAAGVPDAEQHGHIPLPGLLERLGRPEPPVDAGGLADPRP